LVTGASGYIGRRLVAAARARGFEVTAAVRNRQRYRAPGGVAVREFDLNRPGESGELLDGVEALIHLAAIITVDAREDDDRDDPNVRGSEALLAAARRCGLERFVFLSSQSAAAGSPTDYGRSKWRIERLLNGKGECAVRTGLVSGGAPRGVYGTLFRLAKRSPVVPVLRSDAPIYPLHVDDLIGGLLALVEAPVDPPQLVRITPDEPVGFGDYVRMLGRRRLGRPVRLLAIPARAVLALCRITERLPFLPTIGSERVLGLLALKPMDRTMPLPPGMPPVRDLGPLLEAEGMRRRLLAEGRVLTRYILGRPAPGGVLRRYCRAVRAEEDPAPLDLGLALQAWPALLRTLEPVGGDRSRLRRRLSLALRLVEFTPEAAESFHNYRERNRVVAWLQLGWLVAVEALFLPLRLIAAAFRRPT
jgi:NADH dehydrogenase